MVEGDEHTRDDPGTGSAGQFGSQLTEVVASGDRAEVDDWLREHARELPHLGAPDDLAAAAELLADSAGVVPVWLAWRVGYAHHSHGRFEEAERFYARAADPSADEGDAERAHLLAARAATAWARGTAEESRALADEALGAAQRINDSGALAHAWTAQALVAALEGDRNENLIAYQRALGYARAAGDAFLEARILNNLGSLDNEEARFREAADRLYDAVALNESLDYPPGVAVSRFNLAESRLGQGAIDEALADFAAARSIWQQLGSPMVAFAALGQGDTQLLRGNASQATAAYRQALDLAERHENAQAVVPALAGLARSVVLDEPAEAGALIDRALEQPAALGHVHVHLAGGWVALCRGDRDEALRHARTAEAEAGRRHDATGLAVALELLALADDADPDGRLGEAAAIWTATGNAIMLARNQVITTRLAGDHGPEAVARAQLRSLGVRDDSYRVAGPLMVLGPPARPPVFVHSLGRFSVLRDGEPVPGSAWQSRKARDLVKIMAARHPRPVPRDEVCEMLWPGSGAEARNRLSVLLSGIRLALDPERVGNGDEFVVADRDSIGLHPDTVRVDAAEFDAAAHVALSATADGQPGALGLLEAAAAMYGGHYLEDDPYADWPDERRAQLLTLSVAVRRAIARELADAGQLDRAASWLIGLVADDPFDEAAHRELIRLLAAAGRPGEARRFHAAYAARMAELGEVAVAYEEIMGQV